MKQILIILILFCSLQGFGQIKGYWRLNGNSNDASGNGYNGTDGSTTTYGSGVDNQSAHINATRTNVITISNYTGIPTSGIRTMSFWAYYNTTTGESGMLLSHVLSSTQSFELDYRIESTVKKLNLNYAGIEFKYAIVEPYEKWIYYTLVFNGTNVYVYRNSKYLGVGSHSSYGQTGTAKLNIGFRAVGDYRTFNGRLDDIKSDGLQWNVAKIKNEYISKGSKFSF